ncbi:hypothetical protein GRF59_18170 [Paenibacillus sp. HJL G12]|uniref:Uncharacterized protein n=1 Tax=Paenibacillus dendrobii TaxID=2691084 RepID=A0A7X3ILD8_9BACL|nr:hypothetical protein [Paenibacillus dendrobii]MWV45541.1 hypothetical protein [Paenibacillus dendrobii]
MNGAEPFAATGETASMDFYHIATDKTLNRFTKEWKTNLYGSFSYDPNTYVVNTVTGPTVNLAYASWGLNFSPYLNQVSARNSKSGFKATFTGSYQMACTAIIDFGISYTLDFGNYTDSFDAYASGLQN